MKQVIQNARSGALELAEVPAPTPSRGQVLVRNHFSVVSPGTETMALDFARKSMLGKARSRPDLVAQVLRKVKQEGPLPTLRAVTNRLDAPQPLGYASAGEVVAVGEGVTGFAPGDRVACAGAGYANHAELVVVPENLVVAVPPGLSLDKAAFATLGAIALQGVRVADPRLGEVAAVIGLGLIGQLTVQLLRANGCRVLAIDLDGRRIEEALEQGAQWGATPDDDHDAWKRAATRGHGVDFAIVTAASSSSAPIHLAAGLCRAKGRVTVVGATAMELDRRSFYEKELELRMSMSYGPGRYDHRYEEMGLDYPLAYVRWTENRNLQAFVELAAEGSIDPARLDVRSVPFEQAESVYEALARGERTSLAVLFRYGPDADIAPTRTLKASSPPARGEVGVAFIGAGNYARSLLLPAVAKDARARRIAIVTATGPSARRSAERFDYAKCGTDPALALDDPAVDLVFIATQHDSHAELAERALRAGRSVWLEKPVGISPEQVAGVVRAARESAGRLMVGYNRRFSPHAVRVREAFAGRRAPLSLHYSVAPGPPPPEAWGRDPDLHSGRIIGECCHFVDLCIAIVGAPPVGVHARALGRDPQSDDSTFMLMHFEDGSVASLAYLANASTALPKERFEASSAGTTWACENFRTTQRVGAGSRDRVRTLNQDKGQAAAVAAMLEACREGRPSPIALDEIVAVSATTFAVLDSLRRGAVADVREWIARCS